MAKQTKKHPAKTPKPKPCLHLFSQKIDDETLETIDERWLCLWCGLEYRYNGPYMTFKDNKTK